MNQLVSVIIPTRNRPELLARSIKSVIEQTYKLTEIIVVDDCSDEVFTLDELDLDLDLNSIRLIRNSSRLGGARSRNIGVEVSKGNYICFLDDDDIFYPNKIKLLKAALDLNENFSIAFGKIVFNDKGRRWLSVEYKNIFSFESNVRMMNLIHTNSTLIKRIVFDSVRFYENLERFQDLQFHIEVSQNHNVVFVNECVAEWNVDERNNKITSKGDLAKLRRDSRAFRMLTQYLFSKGVKQEYLYSYYANMIKLGVKAFDPVSIGIGFYEIILNLHSWKNLLNDRRERKKTFLKNY